MYIKPFKNRTLFSPEYLKTFFKWYDFCLVGPYPLKLLFVLFSKTPSSYARLFENEIFLRFGCPEIGSLLYPQSCKSWSNIFSNGFRYAMETSKWRILWLPGIKTLMKTLQLFGTYPRMHFLLGKLRAGKSSCLREVNCNACAVVNQLKHAE